MILPKPIKRFSSLRVQLVASVFLWISPALVLTYLINQSWFWDYAPGWLQPYAWSVPWGSFIVGVLALGAAWYGGEHFIVRQVRALSRAVLRLSGGDLEARTGLHEVAGELGQLAEKFDEMAAALQQRAQERDAAERKLREHAHQQTIVAALGQCALVLNDLDSLFTQAALLSAQMLAVEYSAVFERLPDGRLLLLAGNGWRPGAVRQIFAFDDRESQVGFSAATGEVSVVDDLAAQTQFKRPPLLADHHVAGGMTAAIPTPTAPFGVLAVFTTKPRVFSADEVQFLLSAANTIGMATERRRAEAAAQKLATFVKENPNPALEITIDGALTYFNAAAENLAQAVGRSHPRELLPPNVAEIARGCLHSGSSRANWETKVGDHTLSWSFHPLLSSNVVHCYGEDITARLNLERQLLQAQKMESIGQLAAGVAHDFNNMLTIIQGHTSKLLLDSALPPVVQDSTLAVYGAAERAAGLTRQLLMFSRKNIMQPRPLNLHEVITHLNKMLGRLLGETIALRFDSLPQPPPPIYGDAGMIEQILMNLAVNAHDAMPNGGSLTIHVEECWVGPDYLEHRPEARIGHFVRLQVTDTGCGMSPQVRARIFEPFFTTKEPGKGTGLGLATVFGIVKQHAGWIDVASELGQGTTFSIFFPASNEVPITTNAAVPAAPAATSGSETVLVVEDELALREMARDFLTDCGYQILEASSGRQALQVWGEHRSEIDLLLTDMKMPEGISGLELAEKMVAEQPALRVIFTSGYSDDIVSPEILVRNNARFLPKPYSYADLTRMVRDSFSTEQAGTAP